METYQAIAFSAILVAFTTLIIWIYSEKELQIYERKQELENKTKQKSHIETQEMFKQGYSIEEIARLRKLNIRTVRNHLSKKDHVKKKKS